MVKRKQHFCQICRDDDPEISCVDCEQFYHKDCAIASAEKRAATEAAIAAGEYMCETCLRDAQNDTHCSKCGRDEDEDTGVKYDRLLLCDGCPKAFHLSCMGLKDEPAEDHWFCNDCARSRKSTKPAQVAKTEGVEPVASDEDKQDFCEVCQLSGRLMICDYCPKAYHPTCISQFFRAEDLANEEAKWRCPICEGHSILKREVGITYTTAQLKGRMAERNKENRRKAETLRQRRNRFLKANLTLLRPFITNQFEKKLGPIKADGAEAHARDIFAHGQPPKLVAEGIELKDYQRTAVNWLYHCYENLTGAILADDMGLGKTCMSLSFVSYLHSQGIKGPHLIVAPLSTIGNWQREAQRFVPHLTVAKLCGSGQERRFALDSDELWFGERDLFITTYETLISTESFFTQHFWQTIILDEAHRIKSQAGKVRSALAHIEGGCRVLLTGTPLQNNMVELFQLLNFVWPDVLENSSVFEKAIQDGAVKDEKLLDSVKLLLTKLLLRRKKEDVISLPEKIQKMVWLPMSPLSVVSYTGLLKLKERQETEDGVPLGVRKLMGILTMLRLIACHPEVNVHKLTTRVEPALEGEAHMKASNKLVFVDKLLCSLLTLNAKHFPVKRASSYSAHAKGNISVSGQGWQSIPNFADSEALDFYEPTMVSTEQVRKRNKVLIFSQFTSCLNELEKYCKWRGFEYLRLDGSTNRVIRELDMREFNAPESVQFVYLISTRAGGLGINLFTANHVILYDQDWNPHADTQAVDRAHRIGQDRQVFVYRLSHEWTVEERLIYRQQQKLALEAAVVGARAPQKSPDEGEEGDVHEELFSKLDAREIQRLINYGGSVLTNFGGQEISSFTFMQLLGRSHQDLPEAREVEPVTAESGPLVDAHEDEPIPQGTPDVTDQSVTPVEFEDLAGAQTKRVRKTTSFWMPEQVKQSEAMKNRRRILHENNCFMCNDGGDLIECDQCPKVYHLDCQNLEDVPEGRWCCSWHECWDCYRRGSQVGGHLIHCVNCPKSFCLDCFPVTFRRTVPPTQFWQHLNRMGWEMTPEKMIMFTCNDCRVILEQQKRKSMKAKEREEHKKLLASQNEIARNAALAEAASKNKVINDLVSKVRKSQDFVRAALEALVPKELVDKLSVIPEKLSPVQVLSTLPLIELIAEAMKRGIILGPDASTDKIIQQIIAYNGPLRLPELPVSSARKFNRLLFPLCTNCRLPGHVAKTCLFPQEKATVEAKSGCPNCSGAHQLIGCPSMSVEIQEEYGKRAKLFETITKMISSHAPLVMSKEELEMDAVGMKIAVIGKIGEIVAKIPAILQEAGIHRVEQQVSKKTRAPKVEGNQSTLSAVWSSENISSVSDIKAKQMPVSVQGSNVVAYCTNEAIDKDPATSAILASLDLNVVVERKKKDHGIMGRAETFRKLVNNKAPKNAQPPASPKSREDVVILD